MVKPRDLLAATAFQLGIGAELIKSVSVNVWNVARLGCTALELAIASTAATVPLTARMPRDIAEKKASLERFGARVEALQPVNIGLHCRDIRQKTAARLGAAVWQRRGLKFRCCSLPVNLHAHAEASDRGVVEAVHKGAATLHRSICGGA